VRTGEATAFASEMLQIVADVDPSLQLRNVRRLDALLLEDQSLFRLIASVLLLLTLSVVVLSAAGIYALMSCTVEQRRKEIGIRAALGANPRRILAAIFARALAQLGAGAAVGLAIAASLEAASGGELMANRGAIVMPLVAVFMMLVGLAAAWVPARRGLQIHPINTLRAE
jgi:putative ABC transport system permease protein